MSDSLLEAQDDHGRVWTDGLNTFARACLGVATAVIAVLLLSGCAPQRPPVLQPRTAAVPIGAAYATIAAVRQIAASGEAASKPRAVILDAMGVPETVANEASSEIIVRTDDGNALSVIQPSAADPAPGLRVGERVMIVPGGLLRLVPVPPQG